MFPFLYLFFSIQFSSIQFSSIQLKKNKKDHQKEKYGITNSCISKKLDQKMKRGFFLKKQEDSLDEDER